MKNGLIKMINKYMVVSFDVFDTLIERNVELPKDIFKLTGKTILGDGEGFALKRIEAEHKARELSISREVTIEQIYSQLRAEYEDVTDRLMEEEICQELEATCPKKDIIEVFNAALDQGLDVYIISDMYLSSAVIEKMLEKCGITGYKKIYVSNEYNCNKLSGDLFKKVMSDNGIKKSDIIHIGDSLKADLLGARKAGIKACLISRKKRLLRLVHG